MADIFYKIKATVNGSTDSIDVPVVASKLAHTITINGTPFDGTDDVNLTIEGSGATDNYDPTLANNTYQQIRNASDAGIASSIWEVGDLLPVQLSGTVGTLDIDELLYLYIIGFGHNSTLEGTNIIHFQGFKNADGVNVCLVDGGYGSWHDSDVKYFSINHWYDYNYGGWAACDLRYDVLGSTDVEPYGYGAKRNVGDVGYDPTSTCATNPVPDTLMSCLPSELRLVMKPLTKYTDNVGNASGNVDGNISPTVDYLPLLTEFELFGARTYANSYEQNYQKEYDYYANGNLQTKYKYNDPSTAASYWERSPFYGDTYGFCRVDTSGSRSRNGADYSNGLAPALGI